MLFPARVNEADLPTRHDPARPQALPKDLRMRDCELHFCPQNLLHEIEAMEIDVLSHLRALEQYRE